MLQIGDVYNNVLAKLNKKHGAAAQKKEKDDEDSSSSDEEETTVKKAIARRGLYRRFNKHLSEVSAEDLAKVELLIPSRCCIISFNSFLTNA